MTYTTTPDNFHQKSFRIKHEDDNKFLTKLLSKESSKSIPSFRVYYGDVSSTVPFVWETRPGTPKHPSSDNSHPPPLTPPPSYYTNVNFENSVKKNSRSKILLHNLLRRINPKKPHLAAPPCRSSSSSLSSLSWSSSSLSSFSDPTSTPTHADKRRRRFSSWGSSTSFDERGTEDHRRRRDEVCPPSRLCFGIGKNALLSIVGRGSAAV